MKYEFKNMHICTKFVWNININGKFKYVNIIHPIGYLLGTLSS